MNTRAAENSRQDKPGPARKRKGLFILAAFTVALIILSRKGPVETIDCTPDIIASKPDIIMLGAWWCSYCYQAKRYFQKNGLNYCEYDMEYTDIGKKLYQENGGGAIPKLLIGDYTLSGFNPGHIEQALEILNQHKGEDS